jgi:hypothetical protein
MAKVFAAFADGWGRVLRAPAILLGVLAVTWLVAVPAARVLGQFGAPGPGSGLEAVGDLATGFDRTFTPTLIGMDRLVRRVRGFATDGTLSVALSATAATTLLVWTFLLGGVLDRYARRRPIRAQAFFGASGVFFFRFLRLGVIAAIGYYLLFGLVHAWLFPWNYPWPAGYAADAPVSSLLLPFYAVFLAAAVFWSAVIDYARVRAVVEDRRSMLGAFLAGWRFVVAHPLKTGSLYLLNAAASAIVVGVFAFGFPLSAGAGPVGFAGPLVAAVFLLARMALRLAFFASQTAFFQRSLAHADYTAPPALLWPESPAAEEIINAAPRSGQSGN